MVPCHTTWANYNDLSRQVVTPNGGLVRESPPNALNSGLGIIPICSDTTIAIEWLTWQHPSHSEKRLLSRMGGNEQTCNDYL